MHVGIQAAVSCSEAKYYYLLLSGKVTVGIFAGCAHSFYDFIVELLIESMSFCVL